MPPRGKPAGRRGAAVSADNLLPPLQKDLNVVLHALSTSDCVYSSRLMPEQQQSCVHPTKKNVSTLFSVFIFVLPSCVWVISANTS